MAENYARGAFAHINNDLRGQNPLYQKTTPVRAAFEIERCPYHARQLADEGKSESQRRHEAQARNERRGSFMIKRQKSQPVLRPSRALAYGPDRAAFNRALALDDAQASERSTLLDNAYNARAGLVAARNKIQEIDAQRKKLMGNTREERRALFMMHREAARITRDALSQSRNIRRSREGR